MRWTILYARSRRVPRAVLGVLVCTFGVWALARATGGGTGTVALALVAGAAALGPTLSGHDIALDRTAAIRWWPRRATHLLLIGVVTGTAVTAAQTLNEEYAPAAFIARDIVGLVGLVALTATVLGGHLSWTVPLGWFAFALFLPQGMNATVPQWMFVPAGTPAATWTAVVLGVTGIPAYAMFGGRR
jgi:hypothetical protein